MSTPSVHGKPQADLRKLVGVVLVILAFVAVTAILMPSLRQAKELAQKSAMQWEGYGSGRDQPMAGMQSATDVPAPSTAQVKSFVANIDLTPGTSIGSDPPESIYEAKFKAEIEARNPQAAAGDCQLRLPLPPQLISLADLKVTVNGDATDTVHLDGSDLVWQGRLDAETPAAVEVVYTAVGRGIYSLPMPPGTIIDKFEATVSAGGSGLRLLELSLQPQKPRTDGQKTIYVWKYERLLYGSPIQIDILGVAPRDRLAELAWLGPISVLVFGVLAALFGLAYRPEKVDLWTMLLLVGVFAAAYPLMYFAQDFVSLRTAVVAAAVAATIIIAIRAVTLLGLRVGLGGTAASAAGVLGITIVAALYTSTQGLLLTVEAVGVLIVAMVLLPKMRSIVYAPRAAAAPPPPRPEEPHTLPAKQ